LYHTTYSPRMPTTQKPLPWSPHGGSCHFVGRTRTAFHNARAGGVMADTPSAINDRRSASLSGVQSIVPSHRLLMRLSPPHRDCVLESTAAVPRTQEPAWRSIFDSRARKMLLDSSAAKPCSPMACVGAKNKSATDVAIRVQPCYDSFV